MNRWKNDIAVERVKDVINESTKDVFADGTMKDWIDTKAPPRVQQTRLGVSEDRALESRAGATAGRECVCLRSACELCGSRVRCYNNYFS